MRKLGRDPNDAIIKVTTGVHIDNHGWKWGSILTNGKAEGDAPCESLMVKRIGFHV